MAGISDQGFTILRLSDVVAELRTKAIALFQDLVVPGDSVDVSDSAVLGRLINTISPSIADLWEAAEQDYAAFDPNSATGIALDNLVALGGITRQAETYSSAQVILTGDNGTLVAQGLTVGSTVDSSQWNLVSAVALSPSAASGASFTPLTISDSTVYTITYASITTSNTISYTSGVGATASSIVNGLLTVINASHSSLIGSVSGNVLTVTRTDEFSTVTFSTSTNLGITKVQKIGEVQSSIAGTVKAEANTLTTILTPQLGWNGVTNPIAASPGVNLETDEELRLRFRNTKFERASNILEALYSALINLDDVQELRIYENDTDSTDSLGIPAHSFMPIVLGGLSSEIANAIWDNKPMGIKSYGDTVVNIIDSQGFSHAIGFQRPDPVPVYITLNLTTNSDYPATGDNDIKSALISYFESNLGIGDDVVYSRLYTPINTVAGFQVDNMFIGTSANPATSSNIDIDFNQIASLSSVNIVINS